MSGFQAPHALPPLVTGNSDFAAVGSELPGHGPPRTSYHQGGPPNCLTRDSRDHTRDTSDIRLICLLEKCLPDIFRSNTQERDTALLESKSSAAM
jgi:hypothetical protein